MQRLLTLLLVCYICIVIPDKPGVRDGLEAHQSLHGALKSVAGVYHTVPSHTDAHLVQLNGTVIITVSNSGYLSHLLNFDCFAQRLGLRYAVFSLDKSIHRR